MNFCAGTHRASEYSHDLVTHGHPATANPGARDASRDVSVAGNKSIEALARFALGDNKTQRLGHDVIS